MLPCSVRRVAATAPQSPILSSLPRATATSITRSYRPTQCRRYSSSKPSRDNESQDPSVRQSVQPSAESKTSEAKPSGEKRKRKAKDASEKLKYPSVPTTAHIPSDFLALSSFFSLHRPISVTRGLPRNVSDDAFASIFATQTRGQKAAEVMTTISRTVEELEQPMANLSVQQHSQGGSSSEAANSHQQPHHQHHHQHHGLRKIDLRNADGSETSIPVQVNSMSGQFLPFRPPPLPRPESATTTRSSNTNAKTGAEAAAAPEMAAAMEEAAQQQQDTQTRLYKAMFTIEETTDGNGEVKILAHSPKLIEEPSSSEGPGLEGGSATGMTVSVDRAPSGRVVPRTFLERMALRQLRYEDARGRRDTLLAISVKRQRKLKMKKKKYKKLQKRLRHENLKHGRT